MSSLIFINSHPIQYFAPLYAYLAKDSHLDVEAWYCSDETLHGAKDKEFGVPVKWDTPLLSGYRHQFFINKAFRPSLFNGFWGLWNPDLFRLLRKTKPSTIVVHGWGYATHFWVLCMAKAWGHKICLRAETPLHQEKSLSLVKRKVKYFFLQLLFKRIDYFLYIGQQNLAFYNYFSIPKQKLIFTPYCVDNDFFQSAAKFMEKNSLKSKYGFLPTDKIILYSGKYIPKKRPLDLLKAFALAKVSNSVLVMVGEGELRTEMEKVIQDLGITQKCYLTGFINQTQITDYYAMADLFVMCSGWGETWGLSVNEAMNFSLPIIVSDACGSAQDLVEQEINGKIFPMGDVVQLASDIESILQKSDETQMQMGRASLHKIKNYHFSHIKSALISIC